MYKRKLAFVCSPSAVCMQYGHMCVCNMRFPHATHCLQLSTHDRMPLVAGRAKLEEILAGVTAIREAHERGAGEQELRCERQLNDLEGNLQVSS